MNGFTVKLVGVSPLLHHSSRRFLDPFDPEGKKFKMLSVKKKKSDAELATLSDMEFVLSLYADAEGRPILPAECIEAAIVGGARRSKSGKTALVSVTCSDARLEYDGPKTIEGMLADRSCRDLRPVVVQRNRIVRTRPIFRQWSAKVDVTFDEQVVNADVVRDWINLAGMYCGVGDYRPRFGRFTVEDVK
jgi:hypothetical protein